MKLVVISDTHNQEDLLGTLHGDVLIHCGDMFNLFSSSAGDVDRIDAWFGNQDFELILVTGGNHDLALETQVRSTNQPFRNAVFLSDTAHRYKGVEFYGAPWTPDLHGHAFYGDDTKLKESWAQIPPGTDVLITHTPPYGVLDVSSRGMILGCNHLAKELKRVRPRVHCFGHVHASGGVENSRHTTYINASMVNSQFQLVRRPIEVSL